MKQLLFNPLIKWVIWFVMSRILLVRNRKKHLKIGNLTNLNKVKFGYYNTFYNNVDISNSSLDDFVYVADNTKIFQAKIGKFCSIGPDVRIGLGVHPTDLISTFPAFYSTVCQCQVSFTDENKIMEHGQIQIGNDVWIGARVLILDKIIVGDGAVIAAGAVVTKNVPPYSIVGGVPAKILKMRFEDKEINELLKFKWWDKDLRWIRENSSFFNSPKEFFIKIKGNKD